MALRTYKCPQCGTLKKTFQKNPTCVHGEEEVFTMEVVLEAPQAKFLEPRDPIAKERGKSHIKGLDKILKERARAHSRETMMDDLIQGSPDQQAAAGAGWINKQTGKRIKRIDDK